MTSERAVVEHAAPAVVVVVVTRNAGPFLEATLAALGAQDYPALSVLVVDAGSVQDPTARIGDALPSAFVRRLDGDPGFGGAANEALAAVQGAQFLLICHDDVALDPPAVRVMVEEAFRSNAAIVGPKLVSADHPDVLLEVGRSIDRLGGSHTGIEPGELDQEQHDSVRDVFYVSGAAMLVRADLFAELGGFDPGASPGSEDLDLCWRARLVGARVLVAPDARARRAEAAGARGPDDTPTRRQLARQRVRVVLTCYSTPTLVWVVPVGLTVALFEAVAFSLTRRRAGAFADLGAWWWNLLHFGRLRRARRRAQRIRRVRDRDLHELQVGAGTRAGAFLSQHHADERMHLLGERSRDALEALGDVLRHPAAIALIGFLVFLVVGSRHLFSTGVPEVGTMVHWPGVGDLGAELTSAWRHTGLGSTTAAPPVLAVMAALSTVLFGSSGLALTVVVVGAFAVGAFGVFRLVRALDAGIGGSGAAALVYGISAVPRNAVASGRLGPLLLFALAPFAALLVVRAGRFGGVVERSRRPVLGLAIVTAVIGAWYPPGALVGSAVAAAFLLAAVVAGGAVPALRSLGAALAGLVGGAVLLAPWTGALADLGDDRAAIGLGFRPDLGVAEILRFESGPNGAGVAGWGLLLAAAVALVITDGARRAWATRAWLVALLGYAAVVVPASVSPEAATAAPEAGLAVAALGLAVAAGLACAALGEHAARARVGWAQAAGVAAILGIVLGSFGFLGDVLDGRWRAPEGWASVLAFTEDTRRQGDFRVLWLGDAAVLPLHPVEVDATLAWTMTRNGAGDSRTYLRAPVTGADAVISDALRAARAGRTSRLGRILAPAGVRYVALATRAGLGAAPGPRPPGAADALANQLDLARLGSEPGLVLYENSSWAPARAVLPADSEEAVPIGDVGPLRSASSVDLTDARPVDGRPVEAGTVLLAERFDGDWSAVVGGRALPHGTAFGYTNAFTSDRSGAVSFEHTSQSRRYGLLLIEAAVWVVAVAWWARGRRTSARVRMPRDRVEHRARRRESDALELGDELWTTE